MSARGRQLRSAHTVAGSTAPAAPAAARGRKRVQSNAEETVPKRSKTTDTAEDDPNSDNDDNDDNDEGGNDQQAAPKKAPAKGKGKTPAKGKKIRCVT